MTERSSPSADRLDSWKAIADYLGRDIATVRRWERLKGLPVRRIGPGRGHSVFAYASEIDAWLRASPPTEAPAIAAAPDQSPAPPAPARSTSGWRWPLVATVLLVASGLFWRMPLLPAERAPVRAEMRDTGLVTFDSSGHSLWQYEFSTDDQATKWAAYADVRFLSGAAPGVLAATAYRERAGDKRIRGGELLWWTPKGALAQRFSFDDVVSFGDAKYGEPWVISDFRVHEQGNRRRIAVAARHDHWWPSLVTVLDEQWKRGATFVNSGWVNQVQWLSQDRLAISGYSNALDGGMVAILDLPALDGQSPTAVDSRYRCTTCGSGSPARYAVLPRTEVNQASASPLNGATVQVQDGRILVRTIELPRIAEAVEAIYEFSPSLDLLSASYGDRYWEAHRALEAEGKIRHTRERCPYRDGPQGIKIWDPASQWQTGPAGILPPK